MILARLAQEVRERGGLLAQYVAPASQDGRHGALAAAGTRASARPDDYALLVEAIHEGYLLHYAAGRVVRPQDADLSLLAGDRMYALGLARLAELGDLEAVEAHATSAKAAAAASTVRVTCSEVWASDGNHASNCDGGG